MDPDQGTSDEASNKEETVPTQETRPQDNRDVETSLSKERSPDEEEKEMIESSELHGGDLKVGQ